MDPSALRFGFVLFNTGINTLLAMSVLGNRGSEGKCGNGQGHQVGVNQRKVKSWV